MKPGYKSIFIVPNFVLENDKTKLIFHRSIWFKRPLINQNDINPDNWYNISDYNRVHIWEWIVEELNSKVRPENPLNLMARLQFINVLQTQEQSY